MFGGGSCWDSIAERGWDWTQHMKQLKLECVLKFCYLGDTLGVGGGVRARVPCAWTKFKELSPILTACGASYQIKNSLLQINITSRERFLGPVSKVCWLTGLRHGQWRLRICRAWGEQSIWWRDGCVVCLWRIGREVRSCIVFWVFTAWLRWRGMVDCGGFGHVERKSGDDWVSACRNVVVKGWNVRVGAGRLGENV